MSAMNLNSDLVFLIIQFCNEENFKNTAHMLEQETGLYFDMEYFEDLIHNGEWDKAEKYLSGFTEVEENNRSIQIYFEIRKQKYLEALDKNEHGKALEILLKDLKVLASTNRELFKDMTELLTMDDFKQHASLTWYEDTMSARKHVMNALKSIIEATPQFQGKLKFPEIHNTRLRRLLNQSLNWQHKQCENPAPEPEMTSLFEDHICPVLDQLPQRNEMCPENISASESLPSGKSICYSRENNPTLADTSNGAMFVRNMCTASSSQAKGKGIEESIGKIVEISRCESLSLPCEVRASKICELKYTKKGNGILALAENGIHQLWRWSKRGSSSESEPTCTTKYTPQLWKPRSGFQMINNVNANNMENNSHCFALTKADAYIASTSGAKIVLYNMVNFKEESSFLPSPPSATCIAFYPLDNNIIAIGMENSDIIIYNNRKDGILKTLKGHTGGISSIAFSNLLHVFVSSAVDTQIVVWDSTVWERKKSTALQNLSAVPSKVSGTYIQFYRDQIHFLAVHETQLAVYDTTLQLKNQRMTENFSARICRATLSCDSQMIYVVLTNGIILILDALKLDPRFEIDPSAYLPSCFSSHAYPLIVAAHPHKRNQFALGLSEGGVVIVEPQESQESQGEWTPSISSSK